MAGGSISSTLAGRLILRGNVTASAGGFQPSTISGRLDLGGAARAFSVDGAAGSFPLEITAAVSNGSVVKAGGGTLRLSGPQTYAALLAQSGTVDLETALGTGASSVTVAPAAGTATVNLESDQRLASLTIGNGGVVNVSAPVSSRDDEYNSQLLADRGFENIASSGSSFGQNVPEPGALNLVLMSVPALLSLRRKKRR